MHLRFGLLDGSIVESDDIPESKVQAFLDEAGGKTGYGFLSDVVIETVDDLVAFYGRTLINGIWPQDGESDVITIVQNGEDLEIDPAQVAWGRVVRDAT